jgi:dihydrofolate reductase
MGNVIFLMNVSLDGYIETADHSLDWRSTTTSCSPGSTSEHAGSR